jgi:Reverse transcriptase (RNA-dependent DNA polymerase)
MIQLKIPGDLIQWTNLFLTDRQIQLVINGHTCPAANLETEVSQGSPVSLILFIIYLSGIFEVIKAKVLIKALSFMDDISLLISGNLI